MLSCRTAFARSATPTCRLLPASARSNSSLPVEQENDGQDAMAVAPKRSVPLASNFGDILIPSAQASQAFGRSRNAENSFKPSLSWLRDDEFDTRNSLAGRLARRQSEVQSQSPRVDASSNESSVSHRPSLWPTPAPSDPQPYVHTGPRNDRQARPARDAERGRAPSDSQVGIERRQGGQRGMEGMQGRQAGMEGRQNRSREGQADRWQERDRNRSREPQNRDRRPQASQARAREVKTPDLPSERVVARAPVPRSMHIQTTDLNKLFGSSSAAQPVEAVPTKKSGAMPAALRVQLALEHRGGDYSRYLPTIQGLNQPEQLGPLGAAQLIMARRREAGLKMRRNALGVVQRLVVNEENAIPSP